MRHIACLVAITLCILGGACTTSSHIITGKARSAIRVDQVQVYSQAPTGSEEIALLTVDSSGWTTQGEKDQAVARLKKEAASLGANGVLIVNLGSETSGAIASSQSGVWGGTSTYTSIRASAIFVLEQK